ncbi:hypothetical protein WR25_08217 [Diploscapter pachys]|uniref:Uncharacterized protein n=1 Tax=Diploscapter pachys TaxID=2018661 RepID=A0A2A2L8R5_9BILA|nr:hypothetical protein WR25_08217 [Diploscapter pachys]
MNLFTVEQLELIRRLRTTGITGQEVVEAFKQLEQVGPSLGQHSDELMMIGEEQEFEKPEQDEIPVLEKIDDPEKSAEMDEIGEDFEEIHIEQNPEVSPVMTPTEESNKTPVIVRPQAKQIPTSLLLPLNLSNLTNLTGITPFLNINGAISPIGDEKLRLSVQTVPLASTASEVIVNSSASSNSSVEEGQTTTDDRPARSQRTPMKDILEITTLDDPNELTEFMKQGEEACIADMRNFINAYSLRQTTVAMMTGVSQPYISKLLNGNHRELSLRCRKNIYCWYLNCRRHPSKLSAFVADPATRLETNGDGELIPQRRERYVFRPALIKLLEECFVRTPFPNLNRRNEIASACNNMLRREKKGVPLMQKEVVSAQVVSNWFANKRKELRRKTGGKKSADKGQSPSHHQCMSPNGNEVNENESSSNSIDTPPSTSSFDILSSPSPPIDMLSIVSKLGLPLPFSIPVKSPIISPTTPGFVPVSGLQIPFDSLSSSTNAPLLQAALLGNSLGSPTQSQQTHNELRLAQIAHQLYQQHLQRTQATPQLGDYSTEPTRMDVQTQDMNGVISQEVNINAVSGVNGINSLLSSFNPLISLQQHVTIPSIMCQNTI